MNYIKLQIETCIEKDGQYYVLLTPVGNDQYGLSIPIQEDESTIINKLMEIIDPSIIEDIEDDMDEEKACDLYEQVASSFTPSVRKIFNMYSTMLKGWTSGDSFVSGVLLDFEKIGDKEFLYCNVLLSNMDNGCVDKIIKTDLAVGLVLMAIHDIPILAGESIISLIGASMTINQEKKEQLNNKIDKELNKNNKKKTKEDNKKDDKKKDKQYPDDKKISNIAKKILKGKL